MNRHEAMERVQSVWDQTPTGALCLAVVELVASGVLQRLTFGQINSLAQKTAAEQGDIARAVQYLTGHDFHLLDLQFLYYDEENQPIFFDAETVSEAKLTGSLEHPDSGDRIDNFEDHIFVTFVPSALAKEIVANE